VTKPVPSKTHGALEDLAVTRDVTARKLAEKAIHKREEEYRSLANSMSHLVWMASPDRHIFSYNQCWCEYTGSSHRKVKREAEAWQRVPSRDVSGSCRVAIILVFNIPRLSGDWAHFVMCFGGRPPQLGMKVEMPKSDETMSVSYSFILLGIVEFSPLQASSAYAVPLDLCLGGAATH
jgi:hypothetical protein